MLALVLTAAMVVEDPAVLRATAHDSSPPQAQLWRGDWLEVRGERGGFLQVWDHRRERAGYVRATQVRAYRVTEAEAPALRAVIDFIRDAQGMESLGIGYVALFLKAAPAAQVGAEVFDALGTMAERLARRASLRRAQAGDAALAAHREVAESYGVRFVDGERAGRRLVCYDGEAFRRVLALPGASASARARAAIALTYPECAPESPSPAQALAWLSWAREVLAAVDVAAAPAWLGDRVRLRRATVLAALVHHYGRRSDGRAAAEAASQALGELAAVDRAQLLDEDGRWYEEVAVRVGAARWAAAEAPALSGPLAIETAPGRPGETCVRLLDGRASRPRAPVAERCTYGLVWPASVRVSARAAVAGVAVQPLAGWVELWLFRHDRAGWHVDTLAPAAVDPDLGYVELAGISPDGSRILVAREARLKTGIDRIFQVLRADTLAVEKQARHADRLVAFQKWQAPSWVHGTVALR